MADDTKGSGWITYSGILLVVAGVISILDAIWAFRYNDTVADLVLFESNLEVWGVFWLIVGVVLLAAGFGVFQGEQWARWTGIVASSIAIWLNLSWAVVQPTQGLIGAILAALVLYGLAAHGDVEAA
ncbi:MAG: DUF7144 family membrane protein [Acidimicrobiales bacterium]